MSCKVPGTPAGPDTQNPKHAVSERYLQRSVHAFVSFSVVFLFFFRQLNVMHVLVLSSVCLFASCFSNTVHLICTHYRLYDTSQAPSVSGDCSSPGCPDLQTHTHTTPKWISVAQLALQIYPVNPFNIL